MLFDLINNLRLGGIGQLSGFSSGSQIPKLEVPSGFGIVTWVPFLSTFVEHQGE